METLTLEITYDEAIHLLKKLEYSYKKKGSPFIDKVKKFINDYEKSNN